MTNTTSVFTMLWRIPEFKQRYIGQNIVSKRCRHKSGLEWQIVACPFNEFWSVYLLCSNAESMGELSVPVEWSIKLLDRTASSASVHTEGEAHFDCRLQSTFRFPGCRHFMTMAALQENIHKYADESGCVEVLAELTITLASPPPTEAHGPAHAAAHDPTAAGEEERSEEDDDQDGPEVDWAKAQKLSRARGKRGRGAASTTHTHSASGAARMPRSNTDSSHRPPMAAPPLVYPRGTIVAVRSTDGFWVAELQDELVWGSSQSVHVQWFDQHPGAVPGTGLYFRTPSVDEVDVRSIFQAKLTLLEISANPQRYTLARTEALDFVLSRSATVPPQTPTPITSSL